MANSHPISPETIAGYVEEGAVVLRGVLSPADVQRLQEGIEHNLAHLSPLALVASEPDDPGRFVEDFCTWQNNPAYRDILQNSALPHIAAQLMRSDTVRLYHDHLLVKEADTRQPTPWHQDQPYYNVSGRQNVSFWIPVDRVPLVSTLRFVAGSHEGAWYMPRTFRDSQAKWFAEGTLAELPAIDADPERFRQLGWALEPGDCVAFHMLSLHASSGTGPGARRRVFSARYLGDDARHAPRPWRTSPPFAGLSDRLPDGSALNDPLFPLVWPRPDRQP
ncbi:phytanoyl-CoA dioxygenase [Hydrogenophaga crassostreae]|uniref:Phytanoyl-CoA dioxygenase n=1 Tax=Hydrogenophaga crassostreae TaxID=1763535 RepID=A0A163CFI3_9BURK|nr:phytanoyl-CoA dioxygenase family protein [Hydrogenophaga crassostreae]AOW13555.1 phytanoyl-CoA dioxygenase [Hydrogenophaga crassostreae]OAD41848.1 phytanoyl-CoA dioxygenase [Hydrogenophaga crassostreae]